MFKASNYKLSPKLYKDFFLHCLQTHGWAGCSQISRMRKGFLCEEKAEKPAQLNLSAEEEEEDKEAI